MNSIITRPDIPYYGNVPSNFASGKEINVDGVIPSTGLRFSIGLQCNDENQTDIALEIIVDLFDNILSINSKQNNTWDEIQTIPVSDFFTPSDRKFKFTIQYNSPLYKILINDQEVIEYPQKISYYLVSHLVICGEIQVLQISYTSEVDPSAPPDALQITPPITPPPSYNEVITGNHSVAVNLFSGTNPNYVPEAPREQYGYGSLSSRDYDPQQTSICSLNAASSNFRPVKPSNKKKFVGYFVIIFFIILILLASYGGRKKSATPRYTVDRESVWK